MSTTPTTPTRARDRSTARQRDQMRRLLRTLDRSLAIADVLRRERDALYAVVDSQQQEGRSDDR